MRLIPVSVTVLVFFTFPVFVALLVRIFEKVPITPIKAVSLIAAFAGVALTTGAAPQALDPSGIALALIAAIGTAIFIVAGGQLTRQVGSIGFSLITFTVAAIVFGAWIALAGALNLPETALGWFGLLGGSISFVLAVLCFFTALKAVDTVSATLIANLEPMLANRHRLSGPWRAVDRAAGDRRAPSSSQRSCCQTLLAGHGRADSPSYRISAMLHCKNPTGG